MTNQEMLGLQHQLTELFHSEADQISLPLNTWSEIAPRMGYQDSPSLIFRLYLLTVGLGVPNHRLIVGVKKFAAPAGAILFALIAAILFVMLINDDSDEPGPAPAATPTHPITADEQSPDIENNLETEPEETEVTVAIDEIIPIESPDEAADSTTAPDGVIPATTGPIAATVRAFVAPTAGTVQLEDTTPSLPDVEASPPVTPTALPHMSIERPSGLIALWSGEGNGRNGATGSTFGSSSSSEFGTGVNGLAFEFDAAHQRITLPHEVLNGVGDVTFEAWIKTSQPVGAVISGAGGLSASEFFLLVGGLSTNSTAVRSGAITVFVRGQFVSFDTPGISDGKFHHIVWTRRSEGSNELYFDGDPIGGATLSAGELAIGTNGLWLGQSQICTGCASDRFPFAGLIDEVAVYERALNALEVKRLFEANSPADATGN